MHTSNSELCRLRSKSCYSNSTHRPHSRHSSQRTCVNGCDVKSSNSCTRLGSIGHYTVGIYEENVVNIDLPPLMWFGYNKIPKILSATNTGRTVLINGQWTCGKPYITGGPLNGSYIFSQIHFHSPSEHEIDGRRYPLEMHVVHYKNSYLTQERAMKERDGTIVLVYLFQLIESGATVVSQISKLASYLEMKNSRRELSKIPLDQFAKPFNSNYYTYRSSVPADKNSYLLQWIISCNNLFVTRQEVEELLFVMNSSDSFGYSTIRQPENDVVFRVGEEDYCEWMLSSQVTENPCCHHKKASVREKPSNASVSKKSSKKSLREKPSKKSLREKPSKKSVGEKSSKKCVSQKSSKTSVDKKSSKTSVKKKSSKTCVSKKSSKGSADKKSSKTSVKEKSSKTSVNKKSSKGTIDKNSSKTSVLEKSSKTSVGEKSSETSCVSVKEKKTKKREQSKCDSATNTTPSCSKSDVKEKKQKAKKAKDVSVVKEQSKSKSVEKCSSQGGTSQTSVKKATSSTSKENTGDKKSKKKSAESKSCKAKGKKSSGDVKEKCAETHASKSTEKVDCSETNVKAARKSSEKITTIYEKKQKGQVDPPPQGKKTVEIKVENVQPTETPCNTERSDTTENVECSKIGDNFENNDDMCEDVQINYLFMPNTSSSVHSNVGNVTSDMTDLKIEESLRERGSSIEPKDFDKLPSKPIVNHALVKFPVVKSGLTKQLYLHTKHIFRTAGNNEEFTPHTFQECHMLIERDHDVLQEYSGTLYPNQLTPGNYEQVDLSPRYSDPEDLKIQATECIAKLESLHELSIRAKFLISETNPNGQISDKLSTHKKSEGSIQKMKSFFDAQCQCEQPMGTSVAIDTKFLEEEVNSPCKSLIKWDIRNMRLESLDFKDRNLRKALVGQNGAIRLLKNPNTSGPEGGTASKESLEKNNERGVDKEDDDKSSTKSLQNSSGKQKRTSYFVYDRIEKDENSGKKIFVGRFRTRDEVEVLYKHRNLIQSDRFSSDVADRQSTNNRTDIGGNEILDDVTEKFIRVEDSQSVNKGGTSKEKNPMGKNESKQPEVIILHKFEPKHHNLKTTKNKSKGLIVGKISSKIDADSEKYSQLADMLGVDKTRHPKISFYEFQEADTRNGENVVLDNNSKSDIVTTKGEEDSEEVDKVKVFPSTSDRSDSLDGDLSEGLEGTSTIEKGPKSLALNDSQAAVVVIPIEVDSLSKVEIVLIEHTDDVKKQKVENKYTSYLKHYKRLILKLKSSFL